MKTIVVSLAGNPNVGKTTLLNQLAGSNLQVGNWAGVTIAKKEAFAEYGDYKLHFVDLPGIYTFQPFTEAEQVAVNYLSNAEVDVVLNVIDTTNFTRNLSLTTEILEFERPTVIALNMIDEAEKKGIAIDVLKLEEFLGVSAVETNGKTGKGVEILLEKIVEAYNKGSKPIKPTYDKEVERIIDDIQQKLGQNGCSKQELIEHLNSKQDFADDKQSLEKYFDKDFTEIINDERWGYANGLSKRIFKIRKTSAREITEKLDNVLLHPYLGIFIYMLSIYFIFKISFDFSAPYMDWIDGFLNGFISPIAINLLVSVDAPLWLMRFFSEAIIGGVGFVLTFVPLVVCIFFFITLLEMSGYLPRIAFLMDRFLHRIGLHGNMMTPLLLGFGCNVPAIMATKNMRSKKDKILVTMMIPFMSCPARLVVFAFFAITFFENPALVIAGLYLIGIIMAVLTALVLKRSLFKGKTTNFVLELPPYRVPSMKTVLRILYAHVKSFLFRAGTAIFLVTIVVWFLLNMPPNLKDQGNSVAAYIGKTITPVFEPIGLSDWRATTSLIPAFLAREIVLSTMGIIYKATEQNPDEIVQNAKNFSFSKEIKIQAIRMKDAVINSFVSIFSLLPKSFEVDQEYYNDSPLRDKIKSNFTTLSSFSFMILLLLYNSCVATFVVMIREVGRTYAVGFLAYSFAIAWLLAFAVYQIGSRI